MKKIVPMVCASFLMFIFVFGLTTNFAKADTDLMSSLKIFKTAKVTIPAPGVLSLSYDTVKGTVSTRKESKLSGKQIVHVTAGQKDILIYNFFPDFKSAKITTRTKSTVSSFVGLENFVKEVYQNPNGKQHTVWRVKAGKTARFEVNISAPTTELPAGTYTMILGGVTQIYEASGSEEKLPSVQGTSNSVAIVGEGVPASVKTLDKGSLKLTYESKGKEALLTGVQRIGVTANSAKDTLIYAVDLGFENKTNPKVSKNTLPNGTIKSFAAVSGAIKEKFNMDSSYPGSGYIDVWRIKAGQTAVFTVSISSPAKNMFSGVYSVSVNRVAEVINNEMAEMKIAQRISSHVVMVMGEKANASSTTPNASSTPPTVSTLPKSIESNIKIGHEGEQVSILQQVLKQIGLFSGDVTGYFGNITKKSVTEFQTANALDAVGEVGPKTRALLNAVLNQ